MQLGLSLGERPAVAAFACPTATAAKLLRALGVGKHAESRMGGLALAGRVSL